MKTIFNIARTELKALFYSPVAWVILIIFTFHTGTNFTNQFFGLIRWQKMQMPLYSATITTFAGYGGIFNTVLSSLYLYIPLLTMNILSRETASGSIKLLYSSPLTNTQIILGKYLALLIYGLCLTGVLLIFCTFSFVTIKDLDVPFILICLLGIYLLIATYSAIGLFMSSLTSYNLVAALGTLCALAFLNFMQGIGQEIDFVRDLTYWMGISGRVESFVKGMLTSEDLLYFLLVITLFLSFTIIKLQSARQKTKVYVMVGKYAAVLGFTMLIAYFSTKPALKIYYDATRTKENTLTKKSQEIMVKLQGDFTIHTYVNMLASNSAMASPGQYKQDVAGFERYIRFKPETKMKYDYYYHKTSDNPVLDNRFPDLNDAERVDTLKKLYDWKFAISPYSAISKQVDLSGEDFRFVRVLESGNGKKTFLRYFKDEEGRPVEAETTAAIRRLIAKPPVVGFLTGHGERNPHEPNDRGYEMLAYDKNSRNSLVNQGFDVADVQLTEPVPDSIGILVIAAPKELLNPMEQNNLDQYISKGGNLIIAGEPSRHQQMNAITASLGVQFVPGTLVTPDPVRQANELVLNPVAESADFSFYLKEALQKKQTLNLSTASGIKIADDKGFEVITLFKTDSLHTWNELETTDFAEQSVSLNPGVGEVQQSYPAVVALSRPVRGRQQKIIITGDADWLSNLGIRNSLMERTANLPLLRASLFWLSNEVLPMDMRRESPTDDALKNIGEKAWDWWSVGLKWGLPALLVIFSLVVWIRRRGR